MLFISHILRSWRLRKNIMSRILLLELEILSIVLASKNIQNLRCQTNLMDLSTKITVFTVFVL